MNPERTYFKNGQIRTECWRTEDGVWHRIDGPAHRWWYKNGQLHLEDWYINGIHHRIDGPTIQSWLENGQLDHEAWYINGVYYHTESEFLIAVDLYKANEIAELF